MAKTDTANATLEGSLEESTGRGNSVPPPVTREASAEEAITTEAERKRRTLARAAALGNPETREALYQSHPLQRCLRDIYTATQHGVVSDENYETLGLALIGKGKWEPLIGGPPRE